jgi:hypothetical protein
MTLLRSGARDSLVNRSFLLWEGLDDCIGKGKVTQGLQECKPKLSGLQGTTIFEDLSGLAVFEELRSRLRDQDELYRLLGTNDVTVASWRRRGYVPEAKHMLILQELNKRLTVAEREQISMYAMIQDIHKQVVVSVLTEPEQQRPSERSAAAPKKR